MQLKTGLYFVSTIATSPWGERWVQRDTVEDKTMLPKAVNIQVNETGAAQWYVEQCDETGVLFKISAGTLDPAGDDYPAPTVDRDGKLFSDISGYHSTEWTVKECETCDEGVFIITDEQGNAWQTPHSDDQDPQILLQYMVIPLIYPPKYPTYAQFKFASVEGSD